MAGSAQERTATREEGDGRRRDPVATKAALLHAAVVEFAAKGLAGARIDEIAQRAGVNKQLVYHYFGSKEEIYAAAQSGDDQVFGQALYDVTISLIEREV